MMKRLLLILLTLTITLTTAAQWHVLDMRHGLAESRIRKICQMPDGRIAIATTATIDVYDGTRFTSYKLLPELAYPLHEYHDKRQLTCDKEGRIWLRNARTLYVVDTRAGQVVEDVDGLLKELGLDNQSVAGWKQIHCPSTYHDINQVSAMVRDCYGGLWIGTEENGLLYRNDRRKRQFITTDSAFRHHAKPNFCSNRTNELAAQHAPAATNCTLETDDGYAWLGTRNGLKVFDTNDRCVATISSQQGLSTDNVQSIVSDRRGDIWIATANGISRCHPTGQNSFDITNYGEFDGIRLEGREFRVCQIYRDTTDMISVGFSGGTVNFLPDSVCAPRYTFHYPAGQTTSSSPNHMLGMIVAVVGCLIVVTLVLWRKLRNKSPKAPTTPWPTIQASDTAIDNLKATEESTADAEFLTKVKAAIESHIGDENFSVQTLSEMMAMERTGLYRRMSSLTGKSPSDYIKDIRMDMAARLLKESDLPISSIAERTGFSTTKYFSRVFKQIFSISPQEYRDISS